MVGIDVEERLSESGVLADAEVATGLNDWGRDDTFRIGLRIFIDALEEMNPSAMKREMARNQIRKILTDRLHWIADETAHPEIREIAVERPLIVVGMPRTGTTILYDLLACDPSARAPLYWEAADVWPAPEIATFETDPRIAAAQATVDGFLALAPEITDMLPLGGNLPAECSRFMQYHFSGTELGAFYGVPSHSRWVAAEASPGLYRTHRRILQQLAWKGPRGRWTMKSPVHLFSLGELLAEYPDACLVWTHRDPVTIFTSLVDLLFTTQKVMGALPDRRAIAAETLEVYGAALDRGMTSRDDPRVEERILDIAFRDTANDPVAVVRHVHDSFGIEFSPEHVRRMHAFITAHPKGNHQYNAEDCGYDAETFMARFPAYYERFSHML
jgi:hypothetical protein